MENQRTDNNTIKLVSRLSFFLIILSITSCLIRPDFNLISGFLIIIIFNRYLFKDESLFLKIIIHILIAASILEIIWFFFSLPSFFFLTETNTFWKSLSLMHSIGLTLALIQLLLKIIMCCILYNQYKIVSNNDLTYLKNFSYNSKELN